MRSESTLRRWKRDLRKLIDADENRETSRIAYAMETLLVAAMAKPGDCAWFNPTKDARLLAGFLRKETGREPVA
jgi:hypothetical protein